MNGEKAEISQIYGFNVKYLGDVDFGLKWMKGFVMTGEMGRFEALCVFGASQNLIFL